MPRAPTAHRAALQAAAEVVVLLCAATHAREKLRQASIGGISAFLVKWNLLDQMALGLIFAAAAARGAGSAPSERVFVAVAAPLLWIKLLFFARAFKKVGEMTVLVIEVRLDSGANQSPA